MSLAVQVCDTGTRRHGAAAERAVLGEHRQPGPLLRHVLQHRRRAAGRHAAPLRQLAQGESPYNFSFILENRLQMLLCDWNRLGPELFSAGSSAGHAALCKSDDGTGERRHSGGALSALSHSPQDPAAQAGVPSPQSNTVN